MLRNTHASSHSVCIFVLIFLFCAFMYSPLVAVTYAADFIALISRMEGQVEIVRGGKQPMTVSASAGDKLSEKDTVSTKEGAKAEIVFSDNSTLRLAEQSRIEIEEYTEGNRAVMKMPTGKVKAIVPPKLAGALKGIPKGNRFEIKTPGAVAGVRGTEFFVFQKEDKAEIIVQEGSVATYNPKYPEAIILVNKGNMTSVAGNFRPQPPRPTPPALIKSFDQAVTPGGNPLPWERSSFDEQQDKSKSRDNMQITPPGKSIPQPGKQEKKYDLKDKEHRIKASL